jgi:hypothetical protein
MRSDDTKRAFQRDGGCRFFVFVIGPCGTPVLASVLSYTAYKQSFVYGGLLLFLYGLGTGLPVALVGTAAGGLLKRLDRSRFGRLIDPILGTSRLLLGFYLLCGFDRFACAHADWRKIAIALIDRGRLQSDRSNVLYLCSTRFGTLSFNDLRCMAV